MKDWPHSIHIIGFLYKTDSSPGYYSEYGGKYEFWA